MTAVSPSSPVLRCNGVEDCDGGEDELDCPEERPDLASSGRRPRHQSTGDRAAAGGPALLPLLTGAGLSLLLLALLTLC